jgi:hypothetical protein
MHLLISHKKSSVHGHESFKFYSLNLAIKEMQQYWK